jgi:hypothetical protein
MKKNLSILSLIIDSSILNDEENNGVLNHEQQIFDPDPAPDETETFNNVVVSLTNFLYGLDY